MSAKKSGGPLIGDNRKARHIYEYLETIEAGISLTGPEVKSLRAGQVNFTDSYVEFRRGEAWLIGLHIAPYTNAGYVEQNADRPRKLLMHAQEIASFAAKVEQKGLTVVPSKLYLKHGKIKVELALGRGRKLHDHRVELKRRAETRGYAARIARITAPSGSMTGRRFRSASQPCSLWDVHGMEAYDGGGVWKAPLISRKGKNTDALGRFA